jgi:5-methylcytosine-specific restriction endonuclease McrA
MASKGSSLIKEFERIGSIVAKAKPSDRFSVEYQVFIQSPEWQKKRAERIKLDTVNGKVICQFCGKPIKRGDIEVDHRRYPPKGSRLQAFIDQPIEDLWTLHRECHQFKTKQSRKKQ